MRVHLQETLIRTESTSSTWETNLFNKLHGLQMPFPLPPPWFQVKRFYLFRAKHTWEVAWFLCFPPFMFGSKLTGTSQESDISYSIVRPSEDIVRLNQDLTFSLRFSGLCLKGALHSLDSYNGMLMCCLFLERLCPGGALEWRTLPCPVLYQLLLLLWSVADKIALELCGVDEGRVSGLKYLELVFWHCRNVNIL